MLQEMERPAEQSRDKTFRNGIKFPFAKRFKKALKAQKVQSAPKRVNQHEPTILIVEDESLIRELLVNAMRDNGFVAIWAKDAEQAFDFIADGTQPIDLMLSDVRLPGMDGHELMQLARDFRPELKVLFVTGNPADAILRAELLNTRTDLVTKPFRMKEVLDHVSAMI